MGLQFARQCFCSDNFVTQESSTAFISVREHKWITLPTSTKIISARYGYGTKWYNVQNKVQSLISRRGEVKASNSNFGDPIRGTVKDLEVTYSSSCAKLKNDSECYIPCTGNSDQKCGGKWRQNVYELKGDTEVTTQVNQDAGTTQLNTLSLHDTNNNNISNLDFTDKNVNESNNYENDDSFTLSLNYLNNNGVQNISKAKISVGDDNLDVDNATVTISSNNGSCITSGSGSGSFTINPNSTSNNINLGTLSINDSCNTIAPGAQSLNIL